MRYDKDTLKSDRRRLPKSGPRDMQKKASLMENYDSDTVISVLRDEIRSLRSELSNHSNNVSGNLFSSEQLDIEIGKVVEQTVSEMNLKIERMKTEFELKIKSLEEVVSIKNDLIENMKSNYDISNFEKLLKEQIEKLSMTNLKDNNRPEIEEVIIDPLEKDSGKYLKSFMKISETTPSCDEDTVSKVNKLRNLIGKLPS